MVNALVLLFLLILSCTGYLAWESIVHSRNLRRIRLRITVSGTRGKTSIVRTLASVMRSAGYNVLAKTTGSEARYILPDGSEEAVKRRGITSILEQKKLIRKAAGLRADCVIAEIMSIHPANHHTETHKLIKPNITIFSNFRADHTDVVRNRRQDISELFTNDIFPDSDVVLHENDVDEIITRDANRKGSRLIKAEPGIFNHLHIPEQSLYQHISENLDLVAATAGKLGIPDSALREGIINAKMDIGKAGIYRYEKNGHPVWIVNAFAANDPASTKYLIDSILKNLKLTDPDLFAILSLRADRGERSRQWLDYLVGDGRKLFKGIYLSGLHSPVLKRKIRICEILKTQDPVKITHQVLSAVPVNSVVFGIGNIGGLGVSLVEEWTKTGTDGI